MEIGAEVVEMTEITSTERTTSTETTKLEGGRREAENMKCGGRRQKLG